MRLLQLSGKATTRRVQANNSQRKPVGHFSTFKHVGRMDHEWLGYMTRISLGLYKRLIATK